MIIKICKHHGELTLDNCIKASLNKDGTQAYRCRLCLQESHRKHYLKHKDKVLENLKQYREANADKIKQAKSIAAKKFWQDNKDDPVFREKHREAARKWRKDNAYSERERDRRYTKKLIENLGDAYVRDKIKRDTKLKNEDIPQELIELKRTVMLTKRLIRIKAKERKK